LDPPPPPPNNDNATQRRTPPPASSSSFIHHDNPPACTELSSFSPQSLLQYDKVQFDVSLKHAPDFDTTPWTCSKRTLIQVSSCPTEYYGSEIRAIVYVNNEEGTSFSITGNYSINSNDQTNHRTVLEEKYPRLESRGVIFPLVWNSYGYFLPVFKEAGTGKPF
jgi:hypothetical protein